jgi:hypothetical protein
MSTTVNGWLAAVEDKKRKPRFVAVRQSKLVMRGEELICRASSHTMAKRIANALNKHTPNRRGE